MMGQSIVGLVIFCLVAAPLRAQDLDEAAIAKALKAGADNKFGSWSAGCKAEASKAERNAAVGLIRPTGSYDVIVSTSPGAVAFMAYHAKKEGKTLGVSDVPPWVLDSAVYVFVEPRKPPRDWSNGSTRVPHVEVPSSFSVESIKALAAGDLDVVIVTKDGERRCDILARDWVPLFP